VLKKLLSPEKGLSNSVLDEGFAGVYRDEQYLEYKTYSQTNVLKIRNARAWLKIQNGLDLGDLNLGNEDFKLTMTSLEKIARRLGVTQISFQVSTATRLFALFEREFKAIPSFGVGFKNLGADIPLDKTKFTFADIDIF
jgi:hypothetical protein